MTKWEIIDSDGTCYFVDAERWVVEGDHLLFCIGAEATAYFRDWKMFRRHRA